LYFLLRSVRNRRYLPTLIERFGILPREYQQTVCGAIWFHAVSVGEVLAVTRVVGELQSALPGWRIVVSTTTDTGQALARQRFGESNVFYLPLDLSTAVRAYFRALRPKLLVLAESEFWPNLLHCAHQAGAQVAVINARVSDRSLPGYLRFQRLLRPVMQNVDLFLAQSKEDARRLIQIGAVSGRVHVGGNLKFEVKPHATPAIVGLLAAAIRQEEIGPLLVAGSTLEGEEAMLLDTFRQVSARYPAAMLLLAPRHPERFETVAALLAASGLRWVRRSQWDGTIPLAGGVKLLDTIGELSSLYELADLAFIGGSLVPRGGHNVLEAAQFGKPILVGPHTENFRDIVDIFRKADALLVVTPQSLTPTVQRLLDDDAQRAAVGERAREVMQSQVGATERTVDALLGLLGGNRQAIPVGASAEKRA